MDLETQAMSQIIEAFEPLDDVTRARVLRWAADRFHVQLRVGVQTASTPQPTRDEDTPETFPDIATLYDAANPVTQGDKALVVAYWIQVIGGSEDWESQTVNTMLKNLGHGAANITDALNTLIDQSPRLVIQTRKSGTTKQARKRYRMTTEGVKKVKSMLSKGALSDDR